MGRSVASVSVRVGGRSRELPVLIHRGERRGPTVVVTANVHGDEVTGTAAALALDRALTEEPSALCGTLVLLPTVNPAGLEAGERGLPGGADLNRAFPGGETDEAALVARAVWGEVRRWRPELLVDLHSDCHGAVPYAIVDRPLRGARAETLARVEALAARTGWLVLREYPDDQYRRFALDRSLAGAVLNHLAILAVTLECGPRRIIDAAAANALLGALRRVLGGIGSLDVAPAPARPGGPWQRRNAPGPRHPGLLLPAVAPGTTVRTGDLLAEVRGVDGRALDEIRAPGEALVVSFAERAWVVPGLSIGTLAVREE